MRWQPIPPAAPASLTIFLDPRPFHPSNGNPEAHQYHINHIQCLWHSISANDAAMAAELPLLIAAISPSALPASPLTRCMNTDAITAPNMELCLRAKLQPTTLEVLDESAAQIRHAIATDPQARFLLEQLRRTYARRLALTQRAVMT